MQIDVVVTASHGCNHASMVVGAIRRQRRDGDRLIVVEPRRCESGHSAHEGEEHVVGSVDDFESRLEGLRRSSRRAVLFLEDHGVPGDGFLDCLREFLQSEPDLGAVTFWMRNGTSLDAPSRALFAFVAGAADPANGGARPGIVASSFALTGSPLIECRQAAVDGRLAPGDLEYQHVPRALDGVTTPLPPAMVLRHFQRNTVREALAAVYWNGRHSGWAERRTRLADGPVLHILRRYPGRSYRLLTRRPMSPAEAGVVVGLGAVGLVGWWVGRFWGPSRAAEKLLNVHPEPALS